MHVSGSPVEHGDNERLDEQGCPHVVHCQGEELEPGSQSVVLVSRKQDLKTKRIRYSEYKLTVRVRTILWTDEARNAARTRDGYNPSYQRRDVDDIMRGSKSKMSSFV